MRGVASALEVEEGAFALLRASVHASLEDAREPRTATRTTRRRAEIAEAAHVIIAAQPSARWTLLKLARRIGCVLPFTSRTSSAPSLACRSTSISFAPAWAPHSTRCLDSDSGLGAIAVDAGFTHHSHFSAAFRRAFGMTPSDGEVRPRHATSRDYARF